MRAETSPKFPSFNWMRGVADDHRISIVHRLALIRLCLHRRNDSGHCSPGYDAVADELGVHRATIFRAVDVGVRFGWLAQPIRHGQAPADFVFAFPNVAPERPQTNPKVAGVQSQSRTRAHAKSLSCATDTYMGDSNGRKRTGESDSSAPDFAARENKGTPDERKNLFGKTESEPQAPRKTQGDRFDDFWRAYPKRVAKKGARKAYDKAIEGGATDAALLAGAQRYAAERNGQDPKYTKHPATWLNGGCWEDELSGAPVIDQDGNVVAVQQPPPQHQPTGIIAIGEALAREIEANGRPGGW